MSTNERLLWLDVETTGLDVATEHLLQVAAIVTDLDGVEVSGEYERVVRYEPAQAESMKAAADPYVQNMHGATGLWGRLPSGTPLADIDAEMAIWLAEYAPNKRQARIAGNSVRLDSNFAETYLPKTYAHLHYRVVDCSSLAYVADSWGIAPGYFEKKQTHDAMDDIRESLAEYRWIRQHTLVGRLPARSEIRSPKVTPKIAHDITAHFGGGHTPEIRNALLALERSAAGEHA